MKREIDYSYSTTFCDLVISKGNNIPRSISNAESHKRLRRDLSRIISAKYNRFMEHITNKAFSVSFPFLHR